MNRKEIHKECKHPHLIHKNRSMKRLNKSKRMKKSKSQSIVTVVGNK